MTMRVKVLRIIDGDTIEVEAGGGILMKSRRERIRMYGIDAPESSQKGGKESTKHLEKMIGSRSNAWMNRVSTDQYGRTVGLVYPNRGKPQDSYNFRMVRDGQAQAYMTAAADRKRYQEAEAQAKDKRRGIWKNEKSQKPWEYRRKQRESQKNRRKLKLILVMAAAIAAAAAYAYIRWGPALREGVERLMP